jgi:hypothetical protein
MLIKWDAPRPEAYDCDHPWCRQPCDDEQSWHMFRKYLESSIPRCLEKLSRSTGIPAGHLRRWATNGAWVLRAQSFDNWIHQQWQSRVETGIVETADTYVDRHGRLLSMGCELLERELQKYLDVSRETDRIGLLRPEHLSQIANTFVKLERLHHDQSTENVAVAELDLSQLSLDELKELRRLNRKAGV